MMRCARVATLWLVAILCAGAASAQTPPPPTGPESPFYGEIDLGATFGHKSDTSFGGEVGVRVAEGLDVMLEFGRMGNVGTSDLDARATGIANALGGTASASYKVNYFDAGVRYSFVLISRPKIHPYVTAGFGLAQVTAETVLTVNGTTVGPDQVTFGTDLNGTTRKGFLMIGFGGTMTFGSRYFGDLSYRYGRISAKTDDIPNDTAIGTQRLQIGVGVRF
jgi:opacity protein-like surface antigen